MKLKCSVDCLTVISILYTSVRDGQTDRQTDGQHIPRYAYDASRDENY